MWSGRCHRSTGIYIQGLSLGFIFRVLYRLQGVGVPALASHGWGSKGCCSNKAVVRSTAAAKLMSEVLQQQNWYQEFCIGKSDVKSSAAANWCHEYCSSESGVKSTAAANWCHEYCSSKTDLAGVLQQQSRCQG